VPDQHRGIFVKRPPCLSSSPCWGRFLDACFAIVGSNPALTASPHCFGGGQSVSAQRDTWGSPMTVTIRTEKTEATEVDSDLAAVSEVEAGIRDFVRNDVAYLRRPASGMPVSTEPVPEPSPEVTVSNVNSLIQRVAGVSIAEIQNLIIELESLRELLHAEGQRVQREISGYAQLSQAAMKSTRMIADNVALWKGTADELRNS
jgi:hypothetical protein